MIMARVLVGEIDPMQGTNDQRGPGVRIPAGGQGQAEVLYDSVTDNADPGARRMHVVFHDAHAYPEYLIKYITSPLAP